MTSIFKDVSNFLRLARRWRRSADALIDQLMYIAYALQCGSVAELLACWTQALKGQGSNRSRDAVG